MKCLQTVTFCFALLTSGIRAAAPRPEYSPTFYAPCETVVTPHTSWAKPLAGGPLKVLFLTHRKAMREIIELAERLDMTYTVFAQEASTKFGETGQGVDASWRLIKGNSAAELAADLRRKLEAAYDLIVIGNIDWDTLPIDCRYQILLKVKNGTGLAGRIHGGMDDYLSRILKTTDFAWHSYTWTGKTQNIPDYFGIGEFNYAVDYTQGCESATSVRVTCTRAVKGSRESPRGGFMPPKLPPLEPDTEYVFSVWSRTEGMPPGGASVSLHPQGGLTLPVGETWIRSEKTFRTNDQKLGIGVYLLAYQPGTVWFDNVSLTKKGETGNLLPNPGFEYPGPAPEALAEGIPFQSLPAFAGNADKAGFLRSAFAVTAFGRGRIGMVGYTVPDTQMLTPGAVGDVWDCRQDYDYYLAAAAKLMLWAARRDLPTRFPGETRFEIERGAASGFRLPVSAPGSGTLAVTVRNRTGRIFAETRMDLASAADSADLSRAIGELPRGPAFIDLRALDREGRVTGFGSLGVSVTSPDGIAGLHLEATALASGAPLAGTVEFDGQPRGTLELRAVDYNERVVARAALPVTGASVPFSLALPEALSLCGRLEVDLQTGDGLLDTATTRYTIVDRHPDPENVQFIMWQSYGNDFLSPLIAEQFTRCGVDAQYGGKGRAQSGPRANQWWLPYATRFVDTKTDWYQARKTREQGDLVRSPCLTDPNYRQKVREDLLRTAQAAREVGTGDLTLGDENHFVAGRWDLCFSDTCVADFREWAERNYGSLAVLNASWGAEFADWREVRPKTLEECRKDGNFVPWVDHRLHMESVWAGIHAFSRDVIQEVIPDARVGYEGSDVSIGTWHAADFWKLSRAMNLNNIYYRNFVSQAWADFALPGTLLGAGWFGGYASNRNDVYMRYFPWRAVFKGGNSLWVWAGYGHAGAVMSFDTSLYPFFQTACDEVAELKRGPAKLLITAERCHDGVALLYSAASIHVAETIPGAPRPEDVLNSWVRLLNDMGIASRIVSYAQLGAGEVHNDEFRVLILPCAWGMSAAECTAVTAFADHGGAVLADLMPGLTDDHGRPYAVPPLASLFGAVRQGNFVRKTARLGGVEGTGDAALDGTGLRSGKAMLLNLSLDGYARLPKSGDCDFPGWDEGAVYRDLLGNILAEAGVAPSVTLSPSLPRVEISRFRRDECEYVAILQALPREALQYTLKTVPLPVAETVTVRLPYEGCVYDVRAGKYLGRRDVIRTELIPGLARLYAILPGKVTGVRLQAPRQIVAGQAVRIGVSVECRGRPCDRVVHLEVKDPDGNIRPHYSRTLLAEAGEIETAIPFAFNDPAGKWRVSVRDVATGECETRTIRLIPGSR